MAQHLGFVAALLTMAVHLCAQPNYQYVTAGTGGVTLNYLAAEDTSNPSKFILPTPGACGAGFALATASSGAPFPLASAGGTVQSGVADGAITAGHILVGSSSTAGQVHDSGLTNRNSVLPSTCVVGVALASAAGSGSTVSLLYDGPDSFGAGGNVGLSVVEGTAPTGVSGSDLLWADSTAHRWKMNNNSGLAVNIVASGGDINTSDQVTGTNGLALASSVSVLATNSSKQITSASTTGTGSVVALATTPSLTHPLGGGTAPTINSCGCGTGCAISGTDSAGRVTVGSLGVNPCVINFGSAWTNPPVCAATDETNVKAVKIVTTSGSGGTLTITGGSTFAAGDSVAWLCMGY